MYGMYNIFIIFIYSVYTYILYVCIYIYNCSHGVLSDEQKHPGVRALPSRHCRYTASTLWGTGCTHFTVP